MKNTVVGNPQWGVASSREWDRFTLQVRDALNFEHKGQRSTSTAATGAWTVIGSFEMKEDSVWDMEVRAKAVTATGRAVIRIAGAFYRVGTAAAAQEGATATLLSLINPAGPGVRFTPNGNSIDVEVNDGAVATTEWVCDIAIGEAQL